MITAPYIYEDLPYAMKRTFNQMVCSLRDTLSADEPEDILFTEQASRYLWKNDILKARAVNEYNEEDDCD